MTEPLKIVALISGGGRTVLNVLDKIDAGELDARVESVVSSRADAAGLEKAAARGIKTAVVPSKNFRKDGKPDWAAMSEELNKVILPLKPDLVIEAGFMCLYLIPDELQGRVMNIHPALLPSFCGRGMWGHHVHEAVVNNGMKVTGCTVHFANNDYDSGPVIVQRTCPVYDNDTSEDVAARVFEEECRAYPEAIRLFAEGKLSIDGKIVRIRKD